MRIRNSDMVKVKSNKFGFISTKSRMSQVILILFDVNCYYDTLLYVLFWRRNIITNRTYVCGSKFEPLTGQVISTVAVVSCFLVATLSSSCGYLDILVSFCSRRWRTNRFLRWMQNLQRSDWEYEG